MSRDAGQFSHCPYCKSGGGLEGSNIYRCPKCQQFCCSFCIKSREFLFFTIGFRCPQCEAAIHLDVHKVGVARRPQG